MAARKTGLGRGIDGLFPVYNTDKAGSKKQSDDKQGRKKADAGDKASGEAKASSSGRSGSKSASSKKEDVRENVPDPENAVVMVKISSVEPDRKQPRKSFNEDALQELADSIRQHGVIQPLLVRKIKNAYEIIAGERRWRAAKIAGLKQVPVIIRDYSTREKVEISLIENIQREDLNPIEEAKAYQRLLEEFDLKQDEVAERVAKNRSTITNALRLLKLDDRVQQMLMDEKISAGHARALLLIEDPELQFETAQQVFDKHLSVREVERLTKKISKNGGKAPQDKPEEDTSALDLIYQTMEDNLKEILGTKVTVHRKTDKKGRIEIEYYSNEELERLYDLLRRRD